MNLTYFRPKMRGNVKKTTTQSTSDLSPTHQTFIGEHHIWCYVEIVEVATLVSMIPNFWCSLEVAAAELHICFIIKGNVWWKRTFVRMVTIVVLHHKHMKLFKPFTPHAIAWSVRKGFNRSIRRTKEEKGRLQCWACAMPKPVLPLKLRKAQSFLEKKAQGSGSVS